MDRYAHNNLVRRAIATLVAVLLTSALSINAGTAAAGGAEKRYEAPPLIRAGDVLPAHLFQSGSHRVRDDVQIDGDFLRFELETDYGLYQVNSLAMLAMRVHETRTLAQAINRFNQTNVRFADELRGQLRVGADSWVDILASPVGTASQLTSQLAANVGQTVVELSQFPVGSDIHEASPSAHTAPTAHKRNVASQLNLDVYSSNPRVQEFLDAVARARSGGSIGAGITTVSQTQPYAVSVAGGALDFRIRSELKNLTPASLDRLNDQRLETMDIQSDLRQRFLQHPVFSPRHKTAITAHLDFLGDVAHRGTVIQSALAARTETDALSYEHMARMLALYHERGMRLRELRAGGQLPVAVTRDDTLLVALPVDIVYWSEEAARVFSALAEHADAQGFQRKEIILSGLLSPRARHELRKRSFASRERYLQPASGR